MIAAQILSDNTAVPGGEVHINDSVRRRSCFREAESLSLRRCNAYNLESSFAKNVLRVERHDGFIFDDEDGLGHEMRTSSPPEGSGSPLRIAAVSSRQHFAYFHPRLQHFEAAANAREQVIEIVSEAARELSDRLHLRSLAQRLFGSL